MNQFYVSLIFIGIILISFSLILVLLDKKRVFIFLKNFEEKKQEMVEIISDAEQMIEELNKFSDYVVTQMDFKNEELSMNLKNAHEQIKALNLKSQSNCSLPLEVKTSHETEIIKDSKSDVNMELMQNIAVNGNYNTPADLHEPIFKFDSDIEIENLNFEKSTFNTNAGYKSQSVRSDKVIPINNKYNEVLRLSKCGMADVDIARQLSMGKGEIQLILELNK